MSNFDLNAEEFALSDVLPAYTIDELTNDQIYTLLDALAEKHALELYQVKMTPKRSMSVRIMASESALEAFSQLVRYGAIEDAK